jgi:hypothetical protein
MVLSLCKKLCAEAGKVFLRKSIGQVESGFTGRSKCGIKIAVYNNEVLMAKKLKLSVQSPLY